MWLLKHLCKEVTKPDSYYGKPIQQLFLLVSKIVAGFGMGICYSVNLFKQALRISLHKGIFLKPKK